VAAPAVGGGLGGIIRFPSCRITQIVEYLRWLQRFNLGFAGLKSGIVPLL
jgi:hypothetical protein